MGFSKDFLWGVATADYQIEGAYNEDGKGLGIWDVYTRLPNKVDNNEKGDIACDHYHRFKEDIKLMKELGIKNYRFAISWARILPNGIGKINEKGLKFYSDLVDELLSNGIEPLVTLYHWNFPNELHRKGGWLNRESSDWFAYYTKVVVDALSDRVRYWMTFNEPQVFLGLGYQRGVHAPFMNLPTSELTQMAHHILLAHGKSVQTIRIHAKKTPIIGFAPTAPCTMPLSDSKEHIEEARNASFDFNEDDFIFSNSYWADPIIFGKYPSKAFELLKENMPKIEDGDMEIISQPIDFYGANIYHSQEAYSPISSLYDYSYQGAPKTEMGWPITPDVLYWSCKFIYERYQLPILMTENGMAGPDFIYSDGKVHDPYRIDFLTKYISSLEQAATEGIPILGYMHWSFMDNFEWAKGYSMRFGLVYVDYRTQQRIIKDSGHWYKKVIESNGVSLIKNL